MKRWYVITPEYGQVVPVLDDGTGPMEYGADVVEVEAETKRDAIAFGVRLMLRGRWREFKWCRDQRLSGLSPYAGVKAEPAPSPELLAHVESCELCGDELCNVGQTLAAGSDADESARV